MGYLSPPPSPAPVIVYKDVGGLVSDYQAQTEIYRRESREVRLHECRSACTLALSLPNVCVYPDSLVKFHLAYNAIDRQTDAGVSAELFRSYPSAVQQRLGGLTRQYKVLTGNELISLGVRNCNGDRTMIAEGTPLRRRRTPAAPAAPHGGSIGDLAETVRGAVAEAFGSSAPDPQRPIRVAVARPEPPRSLGVDPSPTASIGVRAVDAPEPPRRPPTAAIAPTPAEHPAPPLIPGGQPILASGAFVPPLPARLAQQ
ncbi:hypothetical protein [Methylosinus sp. Sm6]|uniref:hypothetical protein n=1 Tax=Methylosinus sp. Sm6 TaxID=2866948 RepID=UPI001C99C511|nr:hypothetical protein [Methylosinus sp. Sm6]MBY6242035.1 hypothetical protein [Methylosinus sp. Sm6]